MSGREITLTVYGSPAPQGSKRAFSGARKDGSRFTGTVEENYDRVRSWRQAVLEEARKAAAEPFASPVQLAVSFYLRRPKGHYGTGRNGGILKASAPLYPGSAPDLSKLIRSTEDALTDSGIWADDALVVMISAEKQYAGSQPMSGLDVPGAVIRIEQL